MDGTHLQYTSGAKQVCYDLQVKIRESLVRHQSLKCPHPSEGGFGAHQQVFCFCFCFSWLSTLSFRYYFGKHSNRILTLLQLYDEVSERSSLRSIQHHIAESQQRHDSNKIQLPFLLIAVADPSDMFLKCLFISEVLFTSSTDMVWYFKFGC